MAAIDEGVSTSFKDATGALLTVQGKTAEDWWKQLTDVLTLGRFPDPEQVALQIVQDCLGPYYRTNGQVQQQPQQAPDATMQAQVPQPMAGPTPQPMAQPQPQPMGQAAGPPCPKCGRGQVVAKNRRDGSGVFYGCNQYPACDYIQRG